jgi:hypothetical protein
MTDQSFMTNPSFTGTVGYGLQDFIGLGLLGVWLIFSTIAAPVIIQRAITEGYQAGTALIAGATAAGLGGLTAGAMTATNVAGRNGQPLVTAGLAAGAGAAAAAATVAGSGLHAGQSESSLITRLSYQNSRQEARRSAGQSDSPRFAKDDITGSKAAQALIQEAKGKKNGDLES